MCMNNSNRGGADAQLHVFSTFLGLPPDSTTSPVCGAALTSAYNGRNQPECPKCARLLRMHRAAVAAAKGGVR